jgi:hypothetical protein
MGETWPYVKDKMYEFIQNDGMIGQGKSQQPKLAQDIR